MTNIPDDIINSARDCQDAAEAECQKERYVYGFGTGNAKTVLDLHIARAILAERERCAKIVDTYPYNHIELYDISLAIRDPQA